MIEVVDVNVEEYVRREYTGMKVKLYFDTKLGKYVNPKYPSMATNTQMEFLSELIGCLNFWYCVEGNAICSDNFGEVLEEAYSESTFLVIGFEDSYSKQELELIIRAKMKGELDRS